MQAIKRALAGVQDQARANVTNRYYNNISCIIFTSGKLCPSCKRGHLKKHTCDRCGYSQSRINGIQPEIAKKTRDIERKERTVLLKKVIEKASSQGMCYKTLSIQSGIPIGSIRGYFNGYWVPKQERIALLCQAVDLEMEVAQCK